MELIKKECILCLFNRRRSTFIDINEKINDSITIYEAIQKQLTCIDLTSNPLTQNPQVICMSCFKTLETFYKFLEKIIQAQRKIKTEKFDTLVDVESQVFVDTSQFDLDTVDVKSEPENFDDDFQKNDEDTFDFEWELEEKTEKPSKTTPNPDKPKFVRYLDPSDRTPEILASGEKYVMINGKKFMVPKTQLKSNESDERVSKFLDIKCEICGIRETTFLKLIKHFRREHKEIKKPFLLCCGKKFYRRGRLLDHLDRHDDQVTHMCPHCNRIYKSRPSLKMHIKNIHMQAYEEYICTICGRKFKGLGPLKIHMFIHEEHEDRIFECYICKKSHFKNLNMLRNHFYICHHPVRSATTICHICSHTVRTRDLKAHMRRSHMSEGNERVQCEICNHWVKKRLLKIHQKKHKFVGTNCKLCGKLLKNYGSLYSHMKMVHDDNKKFSCSICEKAFHKEMKLREHIAVQHTREFLFKCRVAECGKQFRAEANWKMHEKRAHPEEYEKFFAPFYIRPPEILEENGNCII